MKTFGLIGKSLSHSFSKSYFEKKFNSEKLDYQYQNFELGEINEFPQLLIDNPEISGLNVTIPYKEQIIKFLDEIDKDANFIGAINTIKLIRTSTTTSLIGYNTDAMGFEYALKPHLKPYHHRALILGTGGVSKAVKFVLNKYGIGVINISRRPLKPDQMSYGHVDKQVIEEHPIIINTSPLGMHPDTDTYPDIPYKYIGKNHLLFDLVYNPAETLFLKKGKENGATIVNGIEMLYHQAEQSWEIWNR